MGSAGTTSQSTWKTRFGPSGIHFFNRTSGQNILLDEISVPTERWSPAPRQVSIALTNVCDLTCSYCYAPKNALLLNSDRIQRWLTELDSQGCLGVGFGGGEPLLHPEFSALCQFGARNTSLAITFTTHGHHFTDALAKTLAGSVHFVRISMDGIGSTYEALRGRPFHILLERLEVIRNVCPFGINFVVNARTMPDLDAAIALSHDLGAREFLLLPEQRTPRTPGIDERTIEALHDWIWSYTGTVALAISEVGATDLPTCVPLERERGLQAYAHIDASGTLKPSSFATAGITLGERTFADALLQLQQETREASQ
jgi:MoaA/NifB/PqqE/SkfB family radical SAM enzyme